MTNQRVKKVEDFVDTRKQRTRVLTLCQRRIELGEEIDGSYVGKIKNWTFVKRSDTRKRKPVKGKLDDAKRQEELVKLTSSGTERGASVES